MSRTSIEACLEAWDNLALMFHHVALDRRMGSRARVLVFGLLALVLIINGLNVLNSYVGRDFMTAIAVQNRHVFWIEALKLVGVFALLTLASVLSRFFEESLGLLWRKRMSWRLFELYADSQVFLHLDDQGLLENPDQRIAEDVRNFTTTTLSFILMLMNGILTVIAFSGVLLSISASLFGVSIAYAALGSWLTFRLGKPLIQLNYQQLDKEAAFRATLIYLRNNGLLMALSRRKDLWVGRAWDRLDDLAINNESIIRTNRTVGFFTTGYSWMIQIIPPLIVAPLFIEGRVEFGVITQSALAFTQIMGAFSLFITQFQSISNYLATLKRLSDMTRQTLKAKGQLTRLKQEAISNWDQLQGMQFQDLTLGSDHEDQAYVRNLDLLLPLGQRVQIVSEDPHALTALMRAIAGVYPKVLSGCIHRPPLNRCLFVTERPYLPPCSLHELFARPYTEAVGEVEAPILAAFDTPIAAIHEALEAVGLEALTLRIEDPNQVQDWQSLLALHEQHRIVIARVLVAEPLFVLLDRLGGVFDPPALASLIARLESRNMTIIRLETSDSLADERAARLRISADGAWTFHPPEQGHGGAISGDA